MTSIDLNAHYNYWTHFGHRIPKLADLGPRQGIKIVLTCWRSNGTTRVYVPKLEHDTN